MEQMKHRKPTVLAPSGNTVTQGTHSSEVSLGTRKDRLDQARALVQKYVPAGSAPELVDELLRERRQAA